MTTTTHPDLYFDGPYFSGAPVGLGEATWQSELEAHGGHHPATMLAGAWYSIGRGTEQDRETLRLLKDGEYWMRLLGQEHRLSLGLNLAAQGFGLMNLGRPGLAARRFREAIAVLEVIGYKHSSDLLQMVIWLARAEAGLYGPIAGLSRLHEGREHVLIERFSTLEDAALLRAQLLERLESDEHAASELEHYAEAGRDQKFGHDAAFLIETLSAGIEALLEVGNHTQAADAALLCFQELLENRNLQSADILLGLAQLGDSPGAIDEALRDAELLAEDEGEAVAEPL